MHLHLFTLCAIFASFAPAIAAADFEISREHAREVLKVHCGACHNPEPMALNPKALRIYNLQDREWSAKMSERQLKNSIARLRERSYMTELELKEVVPRSLPQPVRPKENDIATLESYVRLELQKRILAGQFKP